jgi:transcription termination factor Rho
MATPDQSNDDTPSATGAETSDGKKGKRVRSRGRRGPIGAVSQDEAAEAPAPRPEAAAPERSREPEAPASPPPESSDDRPAPAEPTNGQGDGAPAREGGHGSHGHGGGHGEWQDRSFWKRNKRKRGGRHGGGGGGGGWQQGGGGHGGGGSAYPPQPAPPSTAPVYGELPNPSRFADMAALDALAGEISSGKGKPLYLDELYALSLADLTAFAREYGAEFEGAPNRKLLLAQIFAKASEGKRAIGDRGYVDLTDRGAFVVHEHVNYRLYPEDAYLPESLIRRYGLKRGHQLSVLVQAPGQGERCPAVVRVDKVMGLDPDEISKVTPFEELIPYYPLQRILLEAPEVQKDVSMRAVDILTPIGFGQRGLIVAPPRTGKTVLLQNIANSISENSPETKLIILLIDERPEEVTDFRRHTKGEVVSSTFDESPESHVHCAEMVGEKARRLIEQGKHVVILLDSITRLARAYNALASNSGKIMSGGMEATALQKPKRFFGAARNIEGGGSLTIVASALIDTGSRMDEVIFEEFKGTGNMELHLDRGLVERRVFPAINIDRSGTRKEELIYHPEELQRIYGLRRAMQGLGPIESMEMLIQRLKKTKSNAEFLLSLSRS